MRAGPSRETAARLPTPPGPAQTRSAPAGAMAAARPLDGAQRTRRPRSRPARPVDPEPEPPHSDPEPDPPQSDPEPDLRPAWPRRVRRGGAGEAGRRPARKPSARPRSRRRWERSSRRARDPPQAGSPLAPRDLRRPGRAPHADRASRVEGARHCSWASCPVELSRGVDHPCPRQRSCPSGAVV
jgi:hypothetical protein